VQNDIAVGIPGPEALAAAAVVAGERVVRAHLKIDSGMGRMGVTEWELPEALAVIADRPNLRIEALYTHLANADDVDDPFSAEQIARFETLLKTMEDAGLRVPLHHVANSAGMVRGLVRPGDAVRVGLALFGAEPVHGWRLEPVMRWRTEIARLKEVPPGHPVGYGTTWRAGRPSRIATLPVGYADGYRRALSNRGEVLIRGRRVPVVGRVSMDLLTIDVTDVPEAKPGDEVVLMGRQGGEEIAVEELAMKVDTIAYEVFCGITARVPRVAAGTAAE
jgi:alanine racemase